MTSSSSGGAAETEASQTASSRNTILIGVLLISALYFADTLLRASLKTFWYDELVTVYLCKLPTFGATWAAVLHGGADLNPPLLYLLTRWSQYLFGEGLIATRLPEILGFWLFTLCLYSFASQRLGQLRGAIAALFPVFTLAHYYAYEARPHGILLVSFGLMMLCWQRAREGRKVLLWAFLLWLSYLSGLLVHIYAVYLLIPFLFAEAATLLRGSRPRVAIVAALVLAPPCVLPLYYRLYANFRSGGYSGMHIHLYELVQHFFVFVLGPALAVILFLILLLAWRRRENNPASESPDSPSLSPDELNLALGLILLPIIGVIGIKVSHAYYFDRYFLAATAGYGLLLAQATLARGRGASVARGLFVFMIALLCADTLIAAYCRWHHADIDQVEPSSHIIFEPSPAAPLLRNPALLADTTNLDILVVDEPGFLYFYYYAPPQLRKRLVFAAPRNDAFEMRSLDGYQRLAQWGHVDLRLATYDEFFATHSDFLVYSTNNVGFRTGCNNCTQEFLKAGYTLRSVKEDPYNLLEHFSK